MANKRNWLGMLVMVLAFGITVIGCTGNKIDGIWDFPDIGSKIKFEKGKFQIYGFGGEQEESGPYIIKGDTLTLIDGNRETEFNYSINGNTIILNDNGNILTGIKVGNDRSSAKNSGKSGGKSALVGRWIHESGVTRNKPENMEFLKDGTGLIDGTSITWKVEGNRIIIQSSLMGLACDYKLSGSKLTFNYDDGGSAIFAKK
jgi:hypothetical protein